MGKTPEISELRHRIVVEQLSNAADNQGGFTTTWTTLATIWAKVEPTKAWERAFAQKVEYQRSHVAWIRHRTDITSSMRISFDSRYFQIKGIRRPDEKKFYLVLDLEENQGT